MMHPTQIFMQGGVMMFLLGLITLVLLGNVLRASWYLFVRARNNDGVVIQNCLDGLLFWGGFSVVIGVLGSVVGYHKAMTALVTRGLANPRAVWIGSAEGLVSSIAGLLVLTGAGLCWFILRWQYLRTRSSGR
jgi:hypothetical protein